MQIVEYTYEINLWDFIVPMTCLRSGINGVMGAWYDGCYVEFFGFCSFCDG